MTFSDQVQAMTQEKLIPKVVDNVLNSNIVCLRLIGNALQGKGYDVRKSIKYVNSGTATSFAGLDTFAASQLSTKLKLIYDMRAARQPVAISGMDAVANASAESQTDLVKEALEETQQELVDAIGTMIYGDGTGNTNKDFLGLSAIVDDGTNVGTIGGASRTTYTVLKATVTSSGGTLSLAKMATLFTNISSGSGNQSPTLITSLPTVWDYYEQLLTPTVRENYSAMGYYEVGRTGGAKRTGMGSSYEGLSGQAGFVALTYKGIPMVRDEKATSQKLFMINENWINWYGWDAKGFAGYSKVAFGSSQIEGDYAAAPMSNFTGFNSSGLKTPTNQFGVISDIILLGNLTSWQPRRNGVLTAITGI
jgi:hypothetical protein